MTSQQLPALTIFYDATCPLCAAEMRSLKRYDRDGRIQLEDIFQPEFEQRFPGIDPAAANRILHARSSDGQLLLGLDVTCSAWQLVGRGRWLQLLRWPLVRPLADRGYRLFARHRYTFSYLLTGKKRCQSCRITP